MEINFTVKRKVQIPVVKQNKTFRVQFISEFIFIFFKKNNFEVFTFSKKQLFWELFQKRFTGGICDFRGYPPCIASNPIHVVKRTQRFRSKIYLKIFSDTI